MRVTRSYRHYLVRLFSFAGLFPLVSWAANINWSSNAPANGDWNTAGNWVGGVLPGSTDGAYLSVSGGSTWLSSAATVQSLWMGNSDSQHSITLDGAEANLAVNAGAANYALFMYGGSLTIQNGAKLTTSISGPNEKSAKTAYLGQNYATSVLVSGAGSTATFNQRLYVGGGTGDTTLTIKDGAQVNAYSVQIAHTGSSSSVIVDGGILNTTGSGLSYGIFNIGNYGTGYLKITNNGTVTNRLSDAAIGNQGPGNAGNAIAKGTVDIDSGSWKTLSLYVGNYGEGHLNIKGGTVSNTSGYVGRYAESSGVVTVDGRGKWNNSGTLYVGYNGTGTLNIDGPNAEVTAGATTTTYLGYNANSSGTVNLKNNASWTLQALAGRNGASALRFDNGTLIARQANTSFISNIGTMAILVGGATIDSAGFDIGVVGSGFSGDGRLTKTGLGALTLSGASTHSGGVLIDKGSLVANHELALGTGLTTIANTTSLDSTVVNVTTGSLALQQGGILDAFGSGGVGSWSLNSGDFTMTGGLYNLTIAGLNSFDRIIGASAARFDLFSGSIVLHLHDGFDYGQKYLVFGDFGTGTDTRYEGNVVISGYDNAYVAWIDSSGYLQFAIPEPGAYGLMVGAVILISCLFMRGRLRNGRAAGR